MRDRAFSAVDLGQAISLRMHGKLLGLLVRTVRLLMVFHTRLFDLVRRLLRYTVLEFLLGVDQISYMYIYIYIVSVCRLW